MLASASFCRLRADARLRLARRAVARRTDRAAGGAGWRSATWAWTSGGAMMTTSVRSIPSVHRVVLPPRRPCNRRPNGTPSPAVKTASPRSPPRSAVRAVGGIQAWVGIPGRRASTTIDSTPISAARTTFVAIATILHVHPPRSCHPDSRMSFPWPDRWDGSRSHGYWLRRPRCGPAAQARHRGDRVHRGRVRVPERRSARSLAPRVSSAEARAPRRSAR
jgi:hypothetical protein